MTTRCEPYLESGAGGLTPLKAPWTWELHKPTLNWKGYILWLPLEGEITFTQGKETWQALRGDAFCMAADGENFFAAGKPHEDVLLLWINFAYRRTPTKIPAHLVRLSDHYFVEQLFRRVVFLALDKKAAESNAWLGCLLHELTTDENSQQSRLHRAEPHFRQIKALLNKISAEPSRCWKVSQMAQQTGLSQGHFTRLFKRFADETPNEYVVRARIQQAQNLLQLTDLPIKQISTQLGYCDEFAFSKQFKLRVKKSPSQFRLGVSK